MNKIKLFLENFLVYGIGGVISKLIPLIMVPIITRLLPDSSYFGINDMVNTIISFTSAFAVMGMYDGMYRLFFEREDLEYKKDICSTALVFTLGVSAIVFLLMFILKDFLALVFLGDSQYYYLIYIAALITLIGATNSIISAPTRMQNKRKQYLVLNILSSILAYGLSIPLLLSGYFLIALPLATLTSSFLIEWLFGVLNRKWFSIKRINFHYLKQLLKIALPLFPNFLIYWVFNFCDRLMITNILGISATGIYSVGTKLGHASQLIYVAFAGGWQYFAFSTMKEENQVKTNSLVFEYLGIISFVATMFVCAWSNWIYNMLFVGEYIDGYIVSPYLFLAPLLQMLFQIASNQFLIIKKTWPNLLILSVGAIANIMINIWLIPELGIEGAAIATLLGYVVSNIVCMTVLSKMKLMDVSKRFLIVVLLFVFYLFVWHMFLQKRYFLCTIFAILIMVEYGWLYKYDIKVLTKILKRSYIKNSEHIE